MSRTLVGALAVALALAVGASTVAAASFKVIVNEANPATSLSKAELRDVFLGKVTRWKGGQKAEPVDLVAASPAREAFSEAVLGKPVSAVQSHWQRQIFSGKGVPPSEMANDREVVSFVKGSAGAVGYVSDAAPLDGVKAVGLTD